MKERICLLLPAKNAKGGTSLGGFFSTHSLDRRVDGRSFSSLPGTDTPMCSAGKWEQENPCVPQLQLWCPPNPNPICVPQLQPLCHPNPTPGSSKSKPGSLQALAPSAPAPVSSKSSLCVPQIQLLYLPNPTPGSLQALCPSALQKINPPRSGNQSPADNSQVVFLDHPSEQKEQGKAGWEWSSPCREIPPQLDCLS